MKVVNTSGRHGHDRGASLRSAIDLAVLSGLAWRLGDL